MWEETVSPFFLIMVASVPGLPCSCSPVWVNSKVLRGKSGKNREDLRTLITLGGHEVNKRLYWQQSNNIPNFTTRQDSTPAPQRPLEWGQGSIGSNGLSPAKFHLPTFTVATKPYWLWSLIETMTLYSVWIVNEVNQNTKQHLGVSGCVQWTSICAFATVFWYTFLPVILATRYINLYCITWLSTLPFGGP